MTDITGLAHVALHVKAIDPMFEWYREHFGFDLVVRFPTPELRVAILEEYGGEILIMRRGGLTMELIAAPDHRPYPMAFKSHIEVVAAGGIGHICFQVDDCEKAAAELEAAGVAIDLGPTKWPELGWTSAHFHDLEGNDLEIMSHEPTSVIAAASASMA